MGQNDMSLLNIVLEPSGGEGLAHRPSLHDTIPCGACPSQSGDAVTPQNVVISVGSCQIPRLTSIGLLLHRLCDNNSEVAISKCVNASPECIQIAEVQSCIPSDLAAPGQANGVPVAQ